MGPFAVLLPAAMAAAGTAGGAAAAGTAGAAAAGLGGLSATTLGAMGGALGSGLGMAAQNLISGGEPAPTPQLSAPPSTPTMGQMAGAQGAQGHESGMPSLDMLVPTALSLPPAPGGLDLQDLIKKLARGR